MKFASHYSPELAQLVKTEQVNVDFFKCPAWEELLPQARAVRPTYVHMPLRVGWGQGTAWHTEKKQAVDWGEIETFLANSDTHYINLHWSATVDDYPEIKLNSEAEGDREVLLAAAYKDVMGVVSRFGAERVMIENDHDSGHRHLRGTFEAEQIYRLVEETGSGFLLDLSHARLAARYLQTDFHEYMSKLPVKELRELHVTGIQYFGSHWAHCLDLGGTPQPILQELAGRLLDHLPMTETDWYLFSWALGQIEAGRWGRPWVIAFEYGGVGPFWEQVTEREVLLKQIPRFYSMVHSCMPIVE
ncbi:MAG TPA: DUF692 family protein [Anaerolineae bacterium]|nr:DUF692 family protein [Anaerolineae bacterium]